jgi:hypothetical protein
MKAERRHDLKTNALARGVEAAPDYWREYGSRILLVALVAAIVFLLVRYWNDKKLNDARLVAESVETANMAVHELAELPRVEGGASAAEVAQSRQKVAQQAEQAINTVLNSSKDPKTLANAYLARGDLNWELANFPEMPGSQTLPTDLQLTNRDGLFEQARSSYEKVLDPSYSASTTDVFYARMGLAAVAEDLVQWDQAKSQYQAIGAVANMPESFKQLANTRLADLPKLQTPVLLVPPPVVAPAPASGPSMPTGPIPGFTDILPTPTPQTLPTFGPPMPSPASAPTSGPATVPASGPTTRP